MCAGALALIPATSVAAEVTGHVALSHVSANGLSGLEVSRDGTRARAVSDAGWFVDLTLSYDDGALAAAKVTDVRPILGFDGFPAASRRKNDHSDAEGLAIARDGTHYVSFERYMSVSPYADTDAPRGFVGNLPHFRDYPENRETEAVAIHPDGRIFVFPEVPRLRWRRFEYFVNDGTGRDWEARIGPFAQGGYGIVGADFAEDGTLYLLDRRFLPVLGWRNRVRRVDNLDFDAARVIWTGAWDQFYNLEGLAVAEEPTRRLILIGDNNIWAGPTDIVEIRLTD